jgi:beta-glucosidase
MTYTFLKTSFASLALLLLLVPSNAQTKRNDNIPSEKDLVTYKHPRNKIYHKDWIDFNKNGKMDVYENPKAPIDERIEDLLSQMTVEEKTCQMATLYGYKRILENDLPTPEWKNKIWKDGIGAIDEHLNGFIQWGKAPSDNPYVWPASRHAWALNEVQRFFVEETRLGIPVDFTNEGIRGVESYQATDFPTQLGLGHTWDRDLIYQVGRITGREAHLLGYTNIYAPILDVGRDQRWGRYEEIYGESPFLVAELGAQMVKGLQYDHQVASTAKHYLAYSNNKGGREGMARNDPQMSPREVENIHVFPYKRIIPQTGLLGVMCSYNDYNGEPIEGSHYWLTERLRNEFGFRGYVVSDSDAVEYLATKHATAQDQKDAVRQSVEAGLNIRCTFRSPDSYILPLRELVNEGTVSMETINDRVRDILRVKFINGQFDSPYRDDLKQADLEVNCEKNNEVSLRASRESVVLLKNQDNLLPLDISSIHKIAVCGPNADETSFALTHYGPLAVEVTSVLKGLQDKCSAKGIEVSYSKGCELVDEHWPESEIIDYPLTEEENHGIQEAAELAKASDVAVVVLGGGIRTCGENKSRSSLDLPGRQLDLLKAVYATGKPVILILINGRPLSINWADQNVPAILEAWYPGPHGGTAIADILFGDCNPSGKLTVTFPKSVGQIPFNFPAKPYSQVDGGRKPGMDGNMTRVNGALYSFGHGLSYTTFEYSDITLSANQITDKDSLTVTCRIKNTGDRSGDEIVQLYTRDVVSSVTTYEKNLRGFERVHLDPGESKTVSFVLHPRDLELLNLNNEWVVEPGEFKVMIGASSTDIRLEDKFEVVK